MVKSLTANRNKGISRLNKVLSLAHLLLHCAKERTLFCPASKSHVKHACEEHETKMGDCDSRGADMAVEFKLEAGQRKFLNKYSKILNKFRNF